MTKISLSVKYSEKSNSRSLTTVGTILELSFVTLFPKSLLSILNG